MEPNPDRSDALWAIYWKSEQEAVAYRATLPDKKSEWTEKQITRMDSLRATAATRLSLFTRYKPPQQRRHGLDS
jgi:hypothetical protein